MTGAHASTPKGTPSSGQSGAGVVQQLQLLRSEINALAMAKAKSSST